MNPKERKTVQSPYVVVLGGNSSRRKATPPPDAHAYHDVIPPHEEKLEAPHAHVAVPTLKTMAHDLEGAKPLPEKINKKKWWSFARTPPKEKQKKENITPHQNPRGSTSGEHVSLPPIASVSPHRVIDVPSDIDRERPSMYRSKFMRGIAKKGYLTSKLAVQLPFQAKVGMSIALLVLVVGIPLISRFSSKPAPLNSGAIVAIGTDALVAQVGKSIELPPGETPLVVIATADDIRRLAVPDSKPGNKVLLYQKTGKIVVYDAEKDKVLGVVNRSQP